jgi:hypothetical protein
VEWVGVGFDCDGETVDWFGVGGFDYCETVERHVLG